MHTNQHFDVIIIGGSYAGLSAAMALGRSLRKVLIIDSRQPCNRYTPHSHNFITHDGATPADIAQKARTQVLSYDTVQLHEGRAVHGSTTPYGFSITTDSNDHFQSKKLIIATGVKDVFPDIQGFEDCWGTTAIHCPYCHGYEFRHKKTAIIADGDRAIHLTALVSNLTNKLSLILPDQPDLTSEQFAKLEKNKICTIQSKTKAFKHDNGILRALVFSDGHEEEFDAVYAPTPFIQHCDIPVSLGCELTETGHIKTDAYQKTTVPGIYAAGDNASMMRSVANAVASGNIAGAMVNNELTMALF